MAWQRNLHVHVLGIVLTGVEVKDFSVTITALYVTSQFISDYFSYLYALFSLDF